jgi:carbamoyl-phosphate synthase/aspartate carbamoyltransferase/dihydroorotase
LKEEILLIKTAKEKGIKVTCEVTPHHLFLSSPATAEQESSKTDGRLEVRPRLTTKSDVEALWENLGVIDCIATDHAPHTLQEKDSAKPPPGVPGLETCLPLMLTAVDHGRLTMADLVQKMHTNPRRIFDLPDQPDTWIEVDENEEYVLSSSTQYTRCGWTPFEGWSVKGRLHKVVLRGKTAYEDGKVLAEKGSGINAR